METRLKEYSEKLNISVDELIDRYIRQEIAVDTNCFIKPIMSLEKLKEISKKEAERDRKNGIFPKPHGKSLIGICNK